MPARIVQVTAGVIRRGDEVLVCQRAPGTSYAGKWEFPGGKVEAGETLEAGMKRELHEELGIDAEVGAMLWRTEHQYEEREPLILTFFAIPTWTGEPRNRCFSAVRWLRVGELGQLDFVEADRKFVEALANGRVR